jgi:type IV pilus biogenesis protein CpaD/CtpE
VAYQRDFKGFVAEFFCISDNHKIDLILMWGIIRLIQQEETMQRTLLVAAVVLMAGCASKPQYAHTTITDSESSARQLKIDNGSCTVESMSVPIPSMAQSAPRNSSGTITASNGQTYQYTKQSNSGFSSGMATGAAARQIAEAEEARDRVHAGCMAAKGWVVK